MKPKTLVDGMEVWFAVCCDSECSSVYYGPFFDEDDARKEANLASCQFAHFLSQYVPPFALTGIPNTPLTLEAKRFILEHNFEAFKHPIYLMSESNVRVDDPEEAFTKALESF